MGENDTRKKLLTRFYRLLPQAMVTKGWDELAATRMKIEELGDALQGLGEAAERTTEAFDAASDEFGRWYNRKGERVSVMEWEALRSDFEKNFRIDLTTIDFTTRQGEKGHVRVSTVLLGLDHNYAGDGPPLLFETLIVTRNGDQEDQTIPERYSTEEQAQRGHNQIVAEIRDVIRENGEIDGERVGQIEAGRARQQDRANAPDGEEEIH